AAEAAEAPGDRFPTLLWPLRGPAQLAARPRGVNLHAAPGTPVRATADGLVVHAGPGLPGVGRAVVLLHPDGKVTLYGACGDLHVEVGQSVRRGEWIARVGPSDAPHLHFQLRQSGEAPDVVPHFVQVPASRPEEAHDAAANERRAEHPG
ncbi:MAG: M23 family metallopeptidase, partial [Myxococcota bacterium]